MLGEQAIWERRRGGLWGGASGGSEEEIWGTSCLTEVKMEGQGTGYLGK